MSVEMGVVDEVENCPNGAYGRRVRSASQDAEEDTLHVLVLSPRPLRNERDSLLEMP